MSLDKTNNSRFTKPALLLAGVLALSGCAEIRGDPRAQIESVTEGAYNYVAEKTGQTAEYLTNAAYNQLGVKREIYEPNLQPGISYEVTWPLCAGDPNLFRSAERARQNGLDQREQGVYFGHVWEALSEVVPGADKIEKNFKNYWGHELYFAYEKATPKEMMRQKGKKVLKMSVSLAGGYVTDLWLVADIGVNFTDQMYGIGQESSLARELNMPQPVDQSSGEVLYESLKRVAAKKWEDAKSFVITDKVAEEANGIIITAIAFTPMQDYRYEIDNICNLPSTAEIR